MRVKLEEKYKDFYTVADLDRAREVIRQERDDDETPAGWARYAAGEAARAAGWTAPDVITAEARTAKNARIWDGYFVGSEHMDIWISFIARSWEGFIVGGAYLTDIFTTGSASYSEHMYIEYYKKQ